MENREILFRGISVNEREFVYGAYYKGRENTYILFKKAPCEKDNQGLHPFKPCEIIPATVGQFTGLLDKNGKKIFEGDRIKSKFKGEKGLEVIQGIVKLDNCNPCFVIYYRYQGNRHDCYEYDFIRCGLRTNYIIGTIHDHLLGATDGK